MKMYYYNPNNYGEEFFVLAENKTNAHEYLLKHLKNKIKKEKPYQTTYHKDLLNLFEKVNPLDDTTFPRKYTLEEYEVGDVIQSEIA